MWPANEWTWLQQQWLPTHKSHLTQVPSCQYNIKKILTLFSKTWQTQQKWNTGFPSIPGGKEYSKEHPNIHISATAFYQSKACWEPLGSQLVAILIRWERAFRHDRHNKDETLGFLLFSVAIVTDISLAWGKEYRAARKVPKYRHLSTSRAPPASRLCSFALFTINNSIVHSLTPTRQTPFVSEKKRMEDAILYSN